MTSLLDCQNAPFAVQIEPLQYLLEVELPGMDKEDVGVQVEQGMLRIMNGAERARLGSGAVVGAMRLPQDVATCSVVADFRGGVLRVRLPRSVQKRSWWPN